MYYLFLKKDQDLARYKKDFDRVKKNIERGKTPVWCEIRSAKINLVESAPYNILLGAFMIIATMLADNIQMNDTVKIATVLVLNSCCSAVANYIFVIAKHRLRIRLCKRLGIEPTEENIAVMESLEYQSV